MVRAIDLAGNYRRNACSLRLGDRHYSARMRQRSTGTTPTNSTTPTWTWVSGGGGNGTYRFKLDNSDLTAGAVMTTNMSYVPLAQTEGTHTLYVQESDAAGNWSASGSFTVVIDTTVPDTNITGQPANPTNQTNASFTFTATETATFECQMDNGGYSQLIARAPRATRWPGAARRHTFQVRAIDTAGNVDITPATYTWDIDNTVPDTNITSQPANPTNQTSASFAFTATKTSTFECQMDNGGYSSCTSPKSYTLAAGSHTFQVRAIDPAGNIDATPAVYTWEIDTTGPNAPVVAGTTPTNSTTPTWTWVSGGGNGTYRFKLDNSDLTAGAAVTTNTSYTPLAQGEGTHTLYVQERDAAGNWSASGSLAIVIDTTVPDTSITGQPTNPTNQTNASFIFTATEAAYFECQMDNGGYSACTSPKSYTLAAGSHTFQVRSIDPAGNIDATPAAYTWEIDTTVPNAPTITGTTPTKDTTPTWTWVSGGGSGTYRFKLDNSDLTTGATTTIEHELYTPGTGRGDPYVICPGA